MKPGSFPRRAARRALRLGGQIVQAPAAGWTELQRCYRPMWLKRRGLENADGIFTQTLPDEKDALFRLARRVSGGVGVEIGSAFGASSCFIAAGLGRGGKLHCVDRWNIEYRPVGDDIENYCYEPDGRLVRYQWDELSEKISYTEVGRYEGDCPTWTEFLQNTDRFKDIIVPLRRESIDASGDFEGQIDILFIDGWHEYDQVLKDTEAWLPKLKPGGFVAYHDHGWAEGVQRVVRDLVAPRATESGLLPNMYWARLD